MGSVPPSNSAYLDVLENTFKYTLIENTDTSTGTVTENS